MNWIVILPITVVMLLLRWKGTSMLVWIAAWWVAIYLGLQYGFSTPVPQSVVNLYMGIVTFVLLLYVTSDESRLRQFKDPLIAFVSNPRYTLVLAALVIALPSLVAAKVYLDMTSPVQAPFFARTIHPANPDSISAYGKTYDLRTLDNPYRSLENTDPEAFRAHVAKGRDIYYKNCFYCHGDAMEGDGLFAYGLAPIPTRFQDSGTIPMLQESFLFWRIAKGAPGLPEEGGPWESAMPAWEQFLSEEEIWDVILFLYDFTGYRPRAREDLEH